MTTDKEKATKKTGEKWVLQSLLGDIEDYFFFCVTLWYFCILKVIVMFWNNCTFI